MLAETPMQHSAANTTSAARNFRIEVPPLESRINYGQVADRFRSPPSIRRFVSLFRALRVFRSARRTDIQMSGVRGILIYCASLKLQEGPDGNPRCDEVES
jgi:hypothetical protein